MTWPLPEAEPNTDEVLSYENTRCLWYLKKAIRKNSLFQSETVALNCQFSVNFKVYFYHVHVMPWCFFYERKVCQSQIYFFLTTRIKALRMQVNLPATSTMSPGTMSLALILCTVFLSCRYTFPISGSYSLSASMASSALRSWREEHEIQGKYFWVAVQQTITIAESWTLPLEGHWLFSPDVRASLLGLCLGTFRC